MPRIAIVGSCITRDLWPIRGAGAEQLLYISRTALPSLFAPPVAGFRPAARPPADMGRHEHAALCADLEKTALRRLVAYAPTHVIFDFIDERYDLLRVGPALATESAELHRSGYLTRPPFEGARPIPRISASCDRLWTEAAGEFAALVRGTPLARAHLILHEARWATHQRNADGSESPIRDVALLAGRPVEIAPYNALLERQEEAFAGLMPPLHRVSAPAHRLADSGHHWGLSPFHYVPEYYAEIGRQLGAFGLGGFTAGRAAPSIPAA